MATQTQLPPRMTLEEYFDFEAKSVERHEYWNGRIYAMPGGTEAHSKISINTGSELAQTLKESPCVVYNGDMRIRTAPSGLYTYADVAIACHPEVERNTLLNPVVLIEVLSKRTRNYDRGDKFQRYRSIPSFMEYLLIDQERVFVEHYQRQPKTNFRNQWSLTEYDQIEEAIYLPSIDVWLRLSDVYNKIHFPA